MLTHLLKVSYRNLLSNKLFSFIIILGLSTGMTVFLFIFQYVRQELSFDRFHTHAQRIYRIQNNHYTNGELTHQRATTYRDAGPTLKEEFPEVEEFTRLSGTFGNGVAITAERKNGEKISVWEENLFYADASFFSVFTFPLLTGDASSALDLPYTAVLTQKAANRYFGKEDPMGKTIYINGEGPFVIRGILQNIPQHSHLQFDLLLSIQSLSDFKDRYAQYWSGAGGDVAYTYVLLKPGADPKQLQSKFPALLQKYQSKQLNGGYVKDEFILQPLTGIHLHSNLELELGENGNSTIVYFLILSALLILVVVWVNCLNLSVVKNMERAKEAGMRRILGAGRRQLAFQFMIDALLLQLMAAFLSLSMIAVLPYLSGSLSAIDLPVIPWTDTGFILVVVSIFLTGVLVIAFYPAFVLSATSLQSVMRGTTRLPKSSSILRQYMVTLQFASSIALLIITGLVYKQIEYMRSQNLGITIDKTLVIKAPRITDPSYQQRTDVFKQEILQTSFVSKATTSSEIPGRPFGSTRVIVKPLGSFETANKYISAWVDEDFLPLFEIKLLEGRNFSSDFKTDNQAIIINEALMKSLHFDNPEKVVGQQVMAQGAGMCTIVGVIQNYHHQSLTHAHLPAAFFFNDSRSRNFFSLKLNPSQPFSTAIQTIEKKWKAVFPENPFEYFFLDEFYNKQYKQDEAFGRSISLFSVLSVIIACLGLFGLASFFAAQRTKEIGIRKVLGASLISVLVLLTRDFLKPVLLSMLIAWPVSWWVIHQWLKNYAFHTSINWTIFILPSFLIVCIALFTISFQTIKAALVNPSQMLRNE